MNPPNALTLSRFVLAAVLMVCLSLSFPGALLVALIVFILASITDALDGQLARKVYGCTDFGKLMDPLADKVLTAAAFIGFIELHAMPAWMVTLIISREMMVTGLRLLAADKGVIIAAGIWGKQKTIWQMVFIIAVLIAGIFQILGRFSTPVWWAGLAVTALTVWSGVVYFRENISLIRH
ncbi:MAG: CDP-diacylglycerol---glycerol-3-phosphate 3-phosphatidyltransferase [Verrucomicrobiota bacterium]|jgi:CDP-diacylglycerol--glycerol-3-phosphate 3-phosphatidyltransferase|nr:CDP-diacylglycerol---glycerol-3-phosphate 3-phosphatidyltransferase [Verrucomicrobiota bacterium]MDK2962885.1 CDP-diacylglycerol---glycerol-3-phosphate 3-phosphatidyltransferase [Verrucomicrobiota bacterium]